MCMVFFFFFFRCFKYLRVILIEFKTRHFHVHSVAYDELLVLIMIICIVLNFITNLFFY